jgi:hypothetical protein
MRHARIRDRVYVRIRHRALDGGTEARCEGTVSELVIEISLHGKTGEMLLVETHPEYVDYPVRDSIGRTSNAILGCAVENFAARVIADLNRKTAIETYPDLARTLADLTTKHPDRVDARRVIELLAAWGRPHPQARWHVAGAEMVPKGVRYIEVATMPRLSTTSLTADPLAPGTVFLGEAERMDDVDLGDLDRVVVGRDWEEISGAALLQREIRIQPTGGGTRTKNRKKPPKASDLPLTGSAGYDETKREVLSVRVDTIAKEALQASGFGRELIEALGRAIASGRTLDDIRASLGDESAIGASGPS